MDLKATLTNKAGPFPVYVWAGLVGVALVGASLLRSKAPATPTTDPSLAPTTDPGKFDSSQSKTTTDANGNTTTTNYSASGPATFGLTNSAQPMGYTNGDVYVNLANSGNPTPTTQPPASVHTVGDALNTDVFNENGWSAEDKKYPWRMLPAQPGETWADFTSRVYFFGPNFAAVTDPAAQKRVIEVSKFLHDTNKDIQTADGTGPQPGSVVVYR